MSFGEMLTLFCFVFVFVCVVFFPLSQTLIEVKYKHHQHTESSFTLESKRNVLAQI